MPHATTKDCPKQTSHLLLKKEKFMGDGLRHPNEQSKVVVKEGITLKPTRCKVVLLNAHIMTKGTKSTNDSNLKAGAFMCERGK